MTQTELEEIIQREVPGLLAALDELPSKNGFPVNHLYLTGTVDGTAFTVLVARDGQAHRTAEALDDLFYN